MELELQPFPVPNEVFPVMPPGKRQDGWAPQKGFTLSEIDPATLAAMCADFRRKVFEIAGKPDPGDASN